MESIKAKYPNYVTVVHQLMNEEAAFGSNTDN